MMRSDPNKAVMSPGLLLSYPSPRVAVGREGRREAKARVGGLERSMSKRMPEEPHPGSLSFADPPRYSLRSRGRDKTSC
jgi:hypothetical protein